MSLLRRRAMMADQKQGENVIYVDSGFLEMNTSTAFSEPTYSESYPDSSASTAFDVNYGDIIHLESSASRANQRIRYYKEDGAYLKFDNIYSGNHTVNDIEAKYARVLLIVAGDIESLSITRRAEDNETINYKIIDRR